MQRILVAEDAQLNRELLEEILREEYVVETAKDGEQALSKLETYSNDIAALLLDLYMPTMDGFTVLAEMKKHGWIGKIPVLIISSEYAVEIENQCFELGVSDFIHKPFVSSIVKNRVHNAIELFSSKKRLAMKVEEQAEVLERQHVIIQRHADQLKEAKSFDRLMTEYVSAIMEVETKLKVLNEEFSHEYNRNPFESIKTRLKSPESISEKLDRKGLPFCVESIQKNLADVAGVRVICSFPDDIYRLADLLTGQDDIILIRRKDYIKHPKSNGYRSLHLILNVPIFLSGGKKYMSVEVQFRTIAMDFWASLEHKLRYKKYLKDTDEIMEQLKRCADSIEVLDYQMQEIRNRIDRSKA